MENSGIGRRLRRLREGTASLAQVQAVGRTRGFDRSKAWYSRVEVGETEPTLFEVIALRLIYAEAMGSETASLEDVLPNPRETVQVTAGLSLQPGSLKKLFSGGEIKVPGRPMTSKEGLEALARTAPTKARRPRLTAAQARLLEIANEIDRARGREAELKLARRLGIDVQELRAAAETVFGRSLFEERERRVGGRREGESLDSIARRRGRVSRDLRAKLEEALAKR